MSAPPSPAPERETTPDRCGDVSPDEPGAERLARIEEAIARLPGRQRAIFLAHCVDGLSRAEIAHRTGLPVHRVERHIARALLKIDAAANGAAPRWWHRWF